VACIEASFQKEMSSAARALTVRRSSRERPDPSAFAKLVDDDRGARGRRPARPVEGTELLEQHLGGEVVALPVHELDDPRERGRLDPRQGYRARRRPADRHPAGRDAVLAQDLAEPSGGGDGGTRGDVFVVDTAVDDERRERRALVDVERRLPAGRDAPPVEPALVADDPSVDALEALAFQRNGESREPVRGEGRIAVALQVDVALPGLADELAAAEYLGREPVRRPQSAKRCERDRQLLVRGRLERRVRIALEDDRAGRQVDRDRSGVGGREWRHLERVGEAGGQG